MPTAYGGRRNSDNIGSLKVIDGPGDQASPSWLGQRAREFLMGNVLLAIKQELVDFRLRWLSLHIC